jgi:hypothetical protein
MIGASTVQAELTAYWNARRPVQPETGRATWPPTSTMLDIHKQKHYRARQSGDEQP